MSLIFRAVVVSRGAQRLLTNTNSIKFNVDLTAPNGISCRCKVLQTKGTSFMLRRDYSTKDSNTEAVSSANIDGHTQVIYNGLLSTNIRRIKLFSLATSITGIAMQPMLYQKMVTAGEVSAMTLPLFGCIAIFALSTPPLLHYVTKRYIVSLAYDEKNGKYIATNYTLFGVKRKFEFTPDDVTIPTVEGMFSNLSIKGKPMFMDAKDFTDQSHYIRIMGYDKPLDLQVENNEIDSDDEDWSKNNNKKEK